MFRTSPGYKKNIWQNKEKGIKKILNLYVNPYTVNYRNNSQHNLKTEMSFITYRKMFGLLYAKLAYNAESRIIVPGFEQNFKIIM